MKCVRCNKKFNALLNKGICPFCKLNHYEYFNIVNNNKINSLKRVNNQVLDDDIDEEDIEIDNEITNKKNIHKVDIKIKEDKSYEEFDSYNWIDPRNKSKWEDFDDEDDE